MTTISNYDTNLASLQVLGVDLHTALTVAGQHFVQLTIEKGYKELMMGTGQTFLHFVENLDNLHQNLSAFYPGERACVVCRSFPTALLFEATCKL